MRKVELREIRNYACRGAELEIEPGELLVLLGPNGAGKTTLLNVIAGLVPYEGHVLFDGARVDAIPTRQRGIGFVFQDLVLFPHLDVASNIAYGLRCDGSSASEIAARVSELLELLGIARLSARCPARLSGGEQQRVALARALAPRPTVLLLDEPFSHLDGRTAASMRAELRELQRRMGTTTVFVTHDLGEAEAMADRIAVVQDGVVEQVSAFEQLILSPRNQKVSEYLGTPNRLECGSVLDMGHGLAAVDCAGLSLVVPHGGQEIRRVVVLPRDVLIATHRPVSSVNVFTGKIARATPRARVLQVQVQVCGCLIAAELPRVQFESGQLAPGSEVFVELKLSKLRVSA